VKARSLRAAARRGMGRSILPLVIVAVALIVVGVVAPAASALFVNGGFTHGFTGWTKGTYLNPGLKPTTPPFTGANIKRKPGGLDKSYVLGPYATPVSDPYTGNMLSYPYKGSYCAVLNYLAKNRNANSLTQRTTVTRDDLAPDGNVHVSFAWAGVAQNPDHHPYQQPYVYVTLRNVTRGTALYETFIFAGDGGAWHDAPWGVQYTDWQRFDAALAPSKVSMGDRIEIMADASGCSLGGHWAYVYLDDFGSYWPVDPHITAADKVYDGNDAATITSRTLTGVRPGDDVRLVGGTATFSSPQVGNAKTVTATGLRLAGDDADRYRLSSSTATTTASITARDFTVAFVTDGTPGATLTGATSQTVVNGGSATPVTANAPAGYRFVQWAFDDGTLPTTDNPVTVGPVVANVTATAHFAPLNRYEVVFETDGTPGATLTGDIDQEVVEGGTATPVQATTPAGYRFIGWVFSDGEPTTTDNPVTVGPVTGDVVVTAHFVQLERYHVTFATDGTPGARLVGDTDQQVTVGFDAMPVEAVAPAGYRFAEWVFSDGTPATTSNPVTVGPVLRDVVVTAQFVALDRYEVAFTTDGTPGATLEGALDQSVIVGEDATPVTAVVAEGSAYKFVHWTFSDGRASVDDAQVVVTHVTGDVVATAHFAARDYAVHFTTDGTPGADLTGDVRQTVPENQYASPVTAVAPPGYGFVCWRFTHADQPWPENPVVVGPVTRNVTATAVFVKSDHRGPITFIEGVPGGWVRTPVELTLTAYPAPNGAPVDYTEYRVHGRAWARGNQFTLRKQGVWTVEYRSVDTNGRVEETQTAVVRIAKTRPTVRDWGQSTVRKGKAAALRYRTSSRLFGKLTVKIVLRHHGRTVRTIKLGKRPVNRRLAARVIARLPLGVYAWRAVAVDPAGNRGVGPWRRLRVVRMVVHGYSGTGPH
jgi:hypothetical protein